MNRFFLILLFFTLTSLPFTPVGADDKLPIKLGMSAAFTGPSKALGLELYRGAMAYLDQVNSSGGIKGHKVVIAAYDDGYNPEPMITNTIRLVEEENVFALFGYVGTPTTTRMLPLLRLYSNKDILLLFPFTGAQPLREPPYGNYIYNLRGSYFQETKGLVDNFVTIGRKRVAVFYQIDAYGRSGWDGVRRALREHNLRIVGEATYRRGAVFPDSMVRQVAILKKSNPDVIISVGSYSACAAFIRDARDSGWDIPIANLSFVNSDRMLQQLLDISGTDHYRYTQNLINSQVVPNHLDLSLPVVNEYRKAMDRAGEIYPAPYTGESESQHRYGFISFEGYLNAKLLCDILLRMDDPMDRSQLRDAIHSLPNFDLGIGSPVNFAKEKHQGLNDIYFTMVKNGMISNMTEVDWQWLEPR